MKLAQAARVLVQALSQREQQPPCAVPALAQGHESIRRKLTEPPFYANACLLTMSTHSQGGQVFSDHSILESSSVHL